ncbi:MAG: alkaline phosphatase D family protein [Limnoraphis robusta]|uniref:Phosphodiesterase n=2 Tax=Limnoraphis TaxID=1332112 RepID=A0A0J9EXZ7_9CYAN|nr:alkaline phosphatase D family protein [Limnoraphis robusta]KMW70025.1 phosphodiesterase [Limnoraphis robusta CS-951]MEA5496111.1 alkaline phosphatase D family protein [Limnoraphis robusta BA-68 BA1]MEA5542711.1 alkaline phosphatase D family protein [Limnoraphis robusta Tam1]
MLNAEDLFNEAFYLANNPDVKAAVEAGIIESGFDHFIESGQFQVRQPSPLYNELDYLAANPTIRDAVTQGIINNGFQHFIEFGQFERRNPSILFDTQFYLTQNPDVSTAVNEGVLTAIEHFVKFGQFEDRPPSLLYNSNYYLSQNPDVAVAVVRDELTGIQHYLDIGATQNRDFSAFLSPDNSPFPNQVAVGDVTQNSAILLTRSTVPGEIEFDVATDPNFNQIITSQTQPINNVVTPVKIEVGNLAPGTQYFYRVTNALGTSEVGSFRTVPPLEVQRGLRFGVSGTVQGELAPYPSLINVPERNLDFFIQLGDTISADTVSPDLPRVSQAITEVDFNTKYNETVSQRAGINPLANLGSSTPIYAVWDDQNLINNFAGGVAPTSRLLTQAIFGTEGEFVNDTPLFETALNSFIESQPLRNLFYGETGDSRTANQQKLYRAIPYGKDAAAFILDVRSFRDESLFPLPDVPTEGQINQFIEQTFTPDRTLLGEAQLEELKNDLLGSEAAGITWKFVFSPVPMQNLGFFEAEDRWEGYADERNELLRFIDENNINNVVFVSGQANGTIVNNLTYQTGFEQPQISTNAFEITVEPTAVQLELDNEQIAAPFGVATVALTPDDLLSPELKDIYSGLDLRFQKDEFIQEVLDNRIVSFGYDPIGLEESEIDAELIQGGYVAAHTFGWTEFVIDPQTQQLQVTVYGIEPYTEEEVETIPAAIINRRPEVVSQFRVNPI